MLVYDLRCEYQENPLGIDAVKPRLSWKLRSDRRGARQTAFQIVAHSGGEELWDTGRVDSAQSTHFPYSGPPLRSGQRVQWKLKVWDEVGDESVWSQDAWWEMGLLDRQDWAAKWIGSSIVGGPRTTAPCPYLRKSFTIHQPVIEARLYVSALGMADCSLNGKKASDEVFTPGWTNYRKRVQYRTYDVTNLIQDGKNVWGVVLGDGWYCGHVAELDRQNYGDRPKFLGRLVIKHADGSENIVVSDESWHTSTGPILESDMIMGESYDARLEMPGWDSPGFSDPHWQPVSVFQDPNIALVAKVNPPVRRQEELIPIDEPKDLSNWSGSRWIFDLGQNMVGWVRLKISGPAGTTVRLRFSEMLKADGTLYTETLRSARATDFYTLKGEGVEVFEPHFTYHGFRYIEVSGNVGSLTREAITGIVIHSNTPHTGSFQCSDALINQLQHNILWGQKGNFVEVPTDCPQRDERLGWTGDAQVFIRTASFNMDVASFFSKWQQDFEDSQSPKGEYPPVVPAVRPFGLSDDGGPAWADAGVICPWTVYLAYGDRDLLERHYESMTRFIEYLKNTSVHLIRVHPDAVKNGIFAGFGDWLSTNAVTPNDLIGTAFFAYSTHLMAKIANVLDKLEDEQKYLALFAEIKRAFNRRFVTPEGLIAGLTQTGYVLALAFDLLPQNMRQTAVEEIVRDIERRDWHLSTGFVGTPYLLSALTEAGRLDVAYRLLMQKSWPSWLYPVTKGATTVWERWDGYTDEKGYQDASMNSFNHYAYGAVGAWLYSDVAGIDLDPESPGYRHILFEPHPGGGINSARAEYESMHGTVLSDWEAKNGSFTWKLAVPTSCFATASIPVNEGQEVRESGQLLENTEGITVMRRENGKLVVKLASGVYQFDVR